MNSRAFSVLGLFGSAQQLVDAIPLVKARVAGRLDAYTPYPIHGIEDSLGLRKSPIAGMVLVMGLIGAIAAIGFELWAGGVDYPIMTAGKPFFSWEAFVPIMFEVTVLFACFTAGLGMLLLLNRLPFFRHPMLRSKSMPMITRNMFALAVELDGQDLDVQAISLVLRDAGAGTVEIIEESAAPGPVSPRFMMRVLAGIAISCVVAGYLTYWGVKLFAVLPPMVHMLDQPRLDAQRESGFFRDGAGMRVPVPGTVARGRIPYTLATQEDAAALANPLPRTSSNMRKGKQVFMTYCSVCHGILGDGLTTLTAAYGAKPANLIVQKVRDYSDGAIYHIIRTGKNAMPPYDTELNDDERWAAVHYVRVLQRALHARDADITKETAK